MVDPATSAPWIKVFAPASIANLGPGVGRLLIFLTPPGFEGYWEEMANLHRASGGKIDPAQQLALREKYSMDAREDRKL